MSKLKNIEIFPNIIENIEYLTIPHGSLIAQKFKLPIYKGMIEGLPQNIDSIIVTSDLQGICKFDSVKMMLLGEVLAESLALIYDLDFPQINPKKSWAFLCGDLYANLEKRGSSGNPTKVWQAFATYFDRVIGIAGNHDDFQNGIDIVKNIENVYFLENEVFELDGLKIAGLSGIIGRKDKNFRLEENDYLKSFEKILKEQPDVVLTHLSPNIEESGFLGEVKMTQILEKYSENLLFCGHSHWDTQQPVMLKNRTQILNADSKVFILINDNRKNSK